MTELKSTIGLSDKLLKKHPNATANQRSGMNQYISKLKKCKQCGCLYDNRGKICGKCFESNGGKL
jgi:hypothetical protein